MYRRIRAQRATTRTRPPRAHGGNRSTVSYPKKADRLSGRADGGTGDDADAVPRVAPHCPDSETARPGRARCACGASLPDDAPRCDDRTARVITMDLALPDPDSIVRIGGPQHLHTPIPDRGS